MATQSILKLIVDPPSLFDNKKRVVEEFYELDKPALIENTVKFDIIKVADTVRTFFIVVDLPSLPGNMVWKNNIFEHLISKITIMVGLDNIELDHQYIIKMTNIDNYPQNLLLKGLSSKKLFKISKKNHKIILPVPIQKIIDDPNEIILVVPYSIKISIQLNPDFLSLYNLSMGHLKVSLSLVIVFYDIEERNKLCEKYDLYIHKHKIHLENI
jgi:hypothetical protein